MGVYLNVSHGLCKVYKQGAIPTFVVPEGAIVVLLQNRYENDPLVRQNGTMLRETTRAPSSLRKNFTIPHPVSVKRDIMRLIDDKSFQLEVLERSHRISHANASTYGRYQFKTFPAGVEAPDLQLIPHDDYKGMQGLDLLNVTNRSRPESILSNQTRTNGYSLRQLVHYGRKKDAPNGQYTIIFSFSCQSFVPYVEKKRKWSHAFLNKVHGKTFEELFYGNGRVEEENDTNYNRARPVKARRVDSFERPRVTTRQGGQIQKNKGPSSSRSPTVRPMNMTALRQNILSNMLRDLKMNSTPVKAPRKRKPVYEDVDMKNVA